MDTNPNSRNSLAAVIRSLLHHKHEISIHSAKLPYSLPAEVVSLDPGSGRLVLDTEYSGTSIDDYFAAGCVSFDIEAVTLSGERELHSISRIAAQPKKIGNTSYRIECQLPDSVFGEEARGAIRVPFILGMQAKASIEVYPRELHIAGQVRNLSVGGCMLNIDIADSIAINVGQTVPGVTLEFPNGERFLSAGSVRHIRPFGNHGRAAVGLQFIEITPAQSEALAHYAMEAEREAAYRAGVSRKVTGHSQLFIPSAREKQIRQHEDRERQKRSRQSPMQRGVLEIAHQLQIAIMYIKNRDLFPEDSLYDCVDTLLYLAKQDRKALLYALAFLRNEPSWVRHGVQVAGQLADMLLLRNPHATEVREAVLGALLHGMGKPLLVGQQLPSLKAQMNPAQKAILKRHVTALRDKLQALGWVPSAVARDVMENASERLDGSGYPAAKTDSELSELAKLVSILKIINKLTHERNGMPPREPIDAYRWVNNASAAFDKTLLVEYIQQYGLYPIGGLAQFSRGFLAWIMDIDGKGMPTKVHVVKNLSFPDTNIDTVLNRTDFLQIGKLEGIVDPGASQVRLPHDELSGGNR